MSLAENLLETIYKLRGIRGKLGFAPYTIKAIVETYSGDFGSEVLTSKLEYTLDQDGQPPKIKFVSSNDYWKGQIQDAELLVYLTPEYSATLEMLNPTNPDPNTRVYFVLDGNNYENAVFQMVYLDQSKALTWILSLKRAANT